MIFWVYVEPNFWLRNILASKTKRQVAIEMLLVHQQATHECSLARKFQPKALGAVDKRHENVRA